MSNTRRAAEMLLRGATLVAEPCPYCAGVRVMKDGRALCVSCGSEPDRSHIDEPSPSIEQQVLELTRQLGSATDPAIRQKILDAITDISGRLALTPEKPTQVPIARDRDISGPD